MATILVVDDRPINREFLVTLLSYDGHHVLEAIDGLEGLEKTRDNHPDLVITDILMPRMDGYDFIRELRVDSDIAKTPVIFSSAHYLREESRRLAESCGVSSTISKPCEPEVILQIVNEVLGSRPIVTPIPPRIEEFERTHVQVLTDKLARKTSDLRNERLRLVKLIALGQKMITHHEPGNSLKEYCDRAREAVGARIASIGVVSDDGKLVNHFCVCDLEDSTHARIALPSGGGVIAGLVDRRLPIRRSNPSGDPACLGFDCSCGPIFSFVGAPIVFDARVYGWLALANKNDADEFAEQDEQLIVMLAAQLALTFENQRLIEAQRQRTAELEREISERKLIEDVLRKKELQFKSLMDSSIIGILLTDVYGQVKDANDAFLRMSGYSRDDLQSGKVRWDQMTPPEQQKLNEESLDTLRRTGSVAPAEREFFTKDGSLSHALLGVTLLEGSDEYCVAFILDINEQKRAEKALAYAASIVETSDDAIYGKTLDGTIVSWNPAAQRMYGYAVDEVIGRHVSILSLDNQADEIPLILARLKRGEAVRHLETVRVAKDGRAIDVSLTISPILGPSSEPIGISTIARDICVRKRAEEENARLISELQDQKQRIDAIVANLPGLVWEAWGTPDQASQRTDFISDYVETMLGYPAEEWLRTPHFWLNIAHPDDREKAARDAATIYASGKGGLHSMRWMAKDGRALWIETHISVICDRAGTPIGMRGVSLDVTERRRAEEEIKKAHDLAIETARIKSEFLANMNHELRTPMNGIIGLTGVLLGSNPTREQKEFLELIKTSADSLMTLINNLMTFSEFDSIELATSVFSIEECVRGTLRQFETSAEKKGLRLGYHLDSQVPRILIGDQGRLKKALLILISNAIKFSKRGEISVSVAQQSRSANQVGLCFTVRDEGVGIPLEKQEMIFNPFTQVDGSTKRAYGGAGVGLAVFRRIVEMLGGGVWVESEPDSGSAFHFTVPFVVNEL